MDEDIRINRALTIPLDEIQFSANRASGPGGQHVNTTDTRVELRWNVLSSRTLSQLQKERIATALASRLNRRGELVLFCGARRSQRRNKEEVILRLAKLVRSALTPLRRRVPTRLPSSVRERRLQDKRKHSTIKRLRRRPDDDD
ncbi:MAG: alternative ribosome rescue aminoacyl-tRNA hydrolase ArfB [bacterium]